ncbi:hypothetical protein HMPREF0044_0508 [Gleimia coleocanis DSM 15436]|uniref:YGGT family protein n=1 Tax=Gleimia coleocanis DSM 15436 TaxID=525245 RepID=C0VZB8_9ACTO|nr:YggT family protein [Gleimia coleocanis]EEH64219.1 hypothetical protein HMPREF0044_0508 [Gleimia coleocanis DSM 15436]
MTVLIHLAGYILVFFAQLGIILLALRLCFDWGQILAPNWEIKPPLSTLVKYLYGITEPVLAYLRKYLPPLRFNEFSVDMGFLIALVAFIVLKRIASFLISV